MDYSYLLENLVLRDEFISEEHVEIGNKLNILCYSINREAIYPFIAFLLVQDDLKEYNLPHLTYVSKMSDFTIEELTRDFIRRHKLNKNQCKYNGIIYNLINNASFILIEVDLTVQLLNNDNMFALTTEIINNKKIVTTDISNELVELFTTFPEIGVLNQVQTNKCYTLPDIVYSTCDVGDLNFTTIFGNSLSKQLPNCSDYYYFHKSLNQLCNVVVCRHAVYNDCKQPKKLSSLTDLVIRDECLSDCIDIYNDLNNVIIPDLLVKNRLRFTYMSWSKIGLEM